MHNFALVVSFIALDNIFGGHTSLRKINVSFLFVHSEHDNDFIPSDSNELLDTSNTSSRKLGEQNHAVTCGLLVWARGRVGAYVRWEFGRD